MKHIRKFNEDMESTGLGLKFIPSEMVNRIEGDIEIDSMKLDTLPDGSELRYGYDKRGAEYALIVKDGEIEVVIYEYEIMNPFVFGDIVVVPGHDSITCYNYKTGESTKEHIR